MKRCQLKECNMPALSEGKCKAHGGGKTCQYHGGCSNKVCMFVPMNQCIYVSRYLGICLSMYLCMNQ
jgi:hypothetical protein